MTRCGLERLVFIRQQMMGSKRKVQESQRRGERASSVSSNEWNWWVKKLSNVHNLKSSGAAKRQSCPPPQTKPQPRDEPLTLQTTAMKSLWELLLITGSLRPDKDVKPQTQQRPSDRRACDRSTWSHLKSPSSRRGVPFLCTCFKTTMTNTDGGRIKWVIWVVWPWHIHIIVSAGVGFRGLLLAFLSSWLQSMTHGLVTPRRSRLYCAGLSLCCSREIWQDAA